MFNSYYKINIVKIGTTLDMTINIVHTYLMRYFVEFFIFSKFISHNVNLINSTHQVLQSP